ncbi:FtsQ-type POTRA domain-containing protein [Erythrobacteraceae bacterium CFH 75059]|uniref:cell division protein FtsQ/DivIB n=1 Tax=Qipengyuania thermophila TaxID=2509361 RepID=UPI00101F97C1|nr:FtsQ-type POTRA domain-containing protein [Qipengyuania thermophila]TCD06175.1 FtsQ-type POTRA domain-containing protein [Erythrobacteraceae bacterium CFH 75059]
MATVSRGGAKGVRRAAAARSRAGAARAMRARTHSTLDSVLAVLPISAERLHALLVVLILAMAAMLAWFVASLAGLPALAGERLAQIAADAGYRVNRVAVTGVERMDEQLIYRRALAEREQSMAGFDAAALREDLLALPWVADARVSRQLPDMLVIDVVERQPHAVLRTAQGTVLIDATGETLEPVDPAAMPELLRVAGAGAARQVGELEHLLDAAPALKGRVREAHWIGNRRWDLHFDTGQVLALPQDEVTAAAALVTFARLDGTNRLLGGEVSWFDMRAPDRMYMRVPGRSDARLAELDTRSGTRRAETR